MRRKLNKTKQITLFILDKSGSMGSIRQTAISGFNEYINVLKNNKVKNDFSLVLFDTESIEKPYFHTEMEKVEPLSEQTYKPMGGTPLYDAVVDAVEDLSNYVDEQSGKLVITVAIMTDGEENSSRKHDMKCMRELIEKLTAKGNWTFVYLGANQDAWANAANYGIKAGNVLGWQSDLSGTIKAFNSLANASVQYTANVARGVSATAAFFNGGDKNVTQPQP